MKVVLLAPTPPPSGGIAGWTMRMLNSKLESGWEVKVVDEKLIGNREVFGDNVKRNYFVEIKRSLRIWKDLIKSLRDKDVKIVHSNIPASTAGMLREIICLIITKFHKRKFIIHYRCTIPNMINSPLTLKIYKILTNLSDLAIVLNKESEDFTMNNSNTNVVTIPNFIEEEEIIRCDQKVQREKINRVIYVGGVIKTKGCYEIIKAAEKFPDIDFRMIGKYGEDIPRIIQSNNVTLLGEKDKNVVKKELAMADIFIFMSYFHGEGFSNALLEAMSNGLPCIVSDWAANKDMIENKGGIVIPAKDEKALIDAIISLDNDLELRKRQSSWNINKVKNNYTNKIVVNMYVNEYDKLIQGVQYIDEKN